MMKFLSGLVIPDWVRTLGITLFALLFLWGAIYAIYYCGVTDERERNAAVENMKLAEYGQQILNLQNKARDDERAHVLATNQLTTEYEKRVENAQTKTNNALRDVASGARQLRIATKTTMPACTNSPAAISSLASGANESSAELSDSAAGFLINLASECDQTAEKLNLAIDVAKADRSLHGDENE